MSYPAHDEQAVLQPKYEICALAPAGFLIVTLGQSQVCSFPIRTSSVLPHLPMLEALDSNVDLTTCCDLFLPTAI